MSTGAGHRTRQTLAIILAIGLGTIACSSSDRNPVAPHEATETDSTSAATSAPSMSETSVDATEPAWIDGDSDFLFDQETIHTLEVTLSEEALAQIDADPTAEEYVEGSLTFNGETIDAVGIRYKGSIGAFVGCVSGSDLFNPSGAKTCTKLSMKVKVDWDGAEHEFYGQRKLQLHSMNLDPTQLHDRLGYHLFREMGVVAPRAVHARLFINGEYVGLFSLVEQIDGRFTRQHFDDGSGNLYKEAWPFTSDGEATDDAALIAALRTNEDDSPTALLTTTFAEQLLATGNAERVLSEWMDLEATMAHVVVDRAIRHDDGPFHWYCFDGEVCEPHNFYWYEDPSGPKLHLIPWDLDNAFENLLSDTNPVTAVADDLGERTNDCAPFPAGTFQLLQRSATCDPLFAALAQQQDLYERIEDELWAGPLAADAVNSLIDRWVAQITDATQLADETHPDALPVERWLDRVEDLKASLEYVRARR